MNRLFMCVNYPLYNGSVGISKKIRTQKETFEKIGYEVVYSAYIKDGVAILEKNKIAMKKQYKRNKLNEQLRRFYLMDICVEYLRNHSFDVGFVRWDAADGHFLKALSWMRKSCTKVLMDFHGYFPAYNPSTFKGKYTRFFTKINGKQLRKYVDYGLTETKNNTLFGIDTMPIDTGINVDEYEPHKYCGDRNIINLISVANETKYHGYDRVLYGLSDYYHQNGIPVINIHLVGKMTPKTCKLIKKLQIEDHVFLYGYQSGQKLMQIYNSCNIGIGPLAPHRTGGKEGTGIKTKEYFAIGLPYFYAGEELLVPNGYPYILKFRPDDSHINLQRVVDFYYRIKDKPELVDHMREFARENYSWEKIFRRALYEMGLQGN